MTIKTKINLESINKDRILEVIKTITMTRKKQLEKIYRELTAINICIEQNNIQIKPIIRIFLNRLQAILNGDDLLPTQIKQETEKTAFKIN